MTFWLSKELRNLHFDTLMPSLARFALSLTAFAGPLEREKARQRTTDGMGYRASFSSSLFLRVPPPKD